MGNLKMNCNLITSIPSPVVSGLKMTSACSIAISGTTAYVLKSCGKSTDGKRYPMAICKVTNFTKSPKVTTMNIPNKLARHANDITFGDKHLFVTTMNKADTQLIKITTSGKIKQKYDYYRKGVIHSFSTCDFMGVEDGKMKFILGVGSSNGRCKYDIAHIEGNRLVYDEISFYSQVIPSTYTANATYYHASSKKLYSTFFERDSTGAIRINHIFNYVLNDIKNEKEFSVANYFRVITPSVYKKFEVEGVIVEGSTKYVVCNCESNNTKYNKDGLFKLKKV